MEEVARVINFSGLKPIITNHVISESVEKRKIPILIELDIEMRRDILKRRLPLSSIVHINSDIYQHLIKGIPDDLGFNEVVYYKEDEELGFIYVIRRNIKRLEEPMVSIYDSYQFKNKFPVYDFARVCCCA